MAKTVSEILSAAADLLEPEGAWAQGDLARNAEGDCVSTISDSAVCWCTVGAIYRVSDYYCDEALGTLEHILSGGIANWNDAPERTQAEVVAKLREAAALSKASETEGGEA
jgi:hypothetical protein